MTYRGHVENGQIALDEPVHLEEGAIVYVQVAEADTTRQNTWDRLRKLAGTVEGPVDWARNHDRYIHGTPQRS